jgi:hypothetical protein
MSPTVTRSYIHAVLPTTSLIIDRPTKGHLSWMLIDFDEAISSLHLETTDR